MIIKFRLISFLLGIYNIATVINAANYIYSDDSSKDFSGPGESSIKSTGLGTLRSTSQSINHQIKGSFSFLVGIKDFITANTGALNIALYNSTYTTPITLKFDIYPYIGLKQISYHVLVILSDSFCVIPYDFSNHPDFVSQFSNATGTRNLTYLVVYQAPNLLKFSENVTGSISFNTLNSNYTDYFCLKSYIHSINSTHVLFSLQVDMSTKIYSLKGTILLNANDIKSRYGISKYLLQFDPPSAMKNNPFNKYATSIFKFYTPEAQVFRPPSVALMLNSWNVSIYGNLYLRCSFSYEPNDTSLILCLFRTSSGGIYNIELDIYILCGSDINCLSPNSYSPQFQLESSSRSSLDGLNLTIAGAANKTYPWSTQFSNYFWKKPKYAGLGITNFEIAPDFKNFSLVMDNWQSQSIGYTLSISPTAQFYTIIVMTYASDWDGFQIYFVNFTEHPDFISVFGQSVGYRVLRYAIPFTQSPDMAERKSAIISFTELSYDSTSLNITLKQNYVSSNSTHVMIDVITEDDIAWISIKGYVNIYTLGPSNSNIELNELSLSYLPYFYNTTGSRSGTFNTTFSHLYLASPGIVDGFLTQFKFPTNIAKCQFTHGLASIWSASDFILTTTTTLTINSGKFYEIAHSIIAAANNPTGNPYFLPQTTNANPTVNQTIKLRIPIPLLSEYALLITDRGKYTAQTNINLKFSAESSPPRIFSIYKFKPFDDTYMYIDVLPFDVPNPSNIKVSMVIAPIFLGTTWTISTYSSGFQYFPSANPLLEWNGPFDFNSFTNDQKNHNTVVGSRILAPDNSVQVSCQVNVTFSGMLRSLYINGEFMLTESTLNDSEIFSIQTFRTTILEPDKLVLVHATGRKLSISSLGFVNCTSGQNVPIAVNFVSYYSLGSNISSTDVTYPNNTRCDTNCLSCKNLTYCYKCTSSLYQFQGICYEKCPYPLVPTNGFCDIKFRNQAFRNQQVSYNQLSKSVYLNYTTDFAANGNYILTLFLPSSLDYFTFPLIRLKNSSYYLAESQQDLIKISTTQSVGTYNTTLYPLVSSDKSIIANVFGFTTVPNNYLVGNYSDSTFDLSLTSISYYKNLTNKTFAQSDNILVQFFFYCTTICQLTFALDGSIEVITNYRTTILSLNFTTYQEYQLRRKLTGVLFFIFKITKATKFNFDISGNYTIYTPSNFLFEDTLTLPQMNNCSIIGCQNCASSINCLSCQEGRFLTLGSRNCMSQCFTDYPFNIPERRCFCSDNIECNFPQNSRCDTYQGLCQPCLVDTDCTLLQFGLEGMYCDAGTCSVCPDNCLKCNKTTCFSCSNGFWAYNGRCECNLGTVRVSKSECADICGDGYKPLTALATTCDDNNTISGDGCSSTCQIEDSYSCHGGGPLSTDWCSKKPSMSIFQVASTTQFLVTFTQLMNFASNLSQIFEISLMNVPSENYKFSLTLVSNKTILIEIIPLASLPQTALIFSVRDHTLVHDTYGNEISNSFFSLQTKGDIAFKNKEVAAVAEALTKFGTAVSTAAAATSGMLFLTSFNPAIIWGLLNLFQLFYCLQLINVQYPQNVQDFFDIFSIGRLNMIPNPFEAIADSFREKPLPVPKQFDLQGMNGLFLVNSGPMLVLWILCLAMYVNCIWISKYLVKVSKSIKTLAMKVRVTFEKGGMLHLWIGSYFDIAVSIFLQFRGAKFTSIFQVISFLSAVGFLCLNFIIPYREYTHPKPMQQKRVSPLYREFIEHPWFKQNYLFILMFRRMAIAIILVFLHDFPVLQITTLLLVHVIPTLLTTFSTPYKKKHIQIVRASDDGIYFFVHFLVMMLVYDNKSRVLTETAKLNIGWIIISFSLICVIVNVVVMMHCQILEIIHYIKLLRNGKRYGRTIIQKRSIKRSLNDVYSKKQIKNRRIKKVEKY